MEGNGGEKMIEPIVWMEEYSSVAFGQPSPVLRKRKRIEFSGWGSTALIEFLHSIGVDTTHPISQINVNKIVNEYVESILPSSTTSLMLDFSQNGRKKKKNKKKVICDEKLRSLFGKKSINRTMIYKLLESHLAEANDQLYSDDDDAIDYLSYANEEERVKEEKREKSHRPKRLIVEASASKSNLKSCFAAVIPENIKLVYLKRSLIENIMEEEKEKEKKGEPSTFETKIVGSFVRTKSDPNDYLQKHSHCLLQVIGVRFSESNKTLFQVSGFIKDVPLSLISDDDFSKEECEDLRQRIKGGMLKRPTVEDLQQKAQILHEDMTKHWLVRELALLKNLIDRANEKGWRREYPYNRSNKRRELLETADEQSKLFQEVPKVIAEDIEPEIDPQHSPEEVKQANDSSPGSILPGSKEANMFDTREDECEDEFALTWAIDDLISEVSEHSNSLQESEKEPTKSEIEAQTESVHEKKLSNGVKEKVVIDLSDEDEDELPAPTQAPAPAPVSTMWHYLDPQGDIQGPFSILMLKNWNDDHKCFPPDFKIWKQGESSKKAVPLKMVLEQTFPY
ncbi:hypothetical protein F8388_026709 [Cannabis sativa]|uniref:Uncharacterized protein n=1 Tax=Cannabis sativa TaxID=3483 RepID=A0A7J6H371_CANSA|nr:hypothetical protein F8388_026709 [Cannabis sativa]